METALLKKVIMLKGLVSEPSVGYSLPMCVQQEDRTLWGVFYYSTAAGEDGAPSTKPVAWALFSPEDGVPLYFTDTRLNKTMAAMGPVGNASPLPDPDRLERGYELFEAVGRADALPPEQLDEAQKAAIAEYRALCVEIVDKAVWPVYFGLAGDFWCRIGLMDVESGKAETPDDAAGAGPAIQLEDIERTLGERLSETEQKLEKKLDEILEQFGLKIRLDAHKETLFNNMHQELQGYKNEIYDKSMMSMAMDVIKLGDDLQKQAEKFEAAGLSEQTCKRAVKSIFDTVQDLVDILFRQGIEPFEAPGDDVDVARQKIYRVLETGDQALDKKIAARLAPGYEREGKIVRPEQISVYKYTATAAPPEPKPAPTPEPAPQPDEPPVFL